MKTERTKKKKKMVAAMVAVCAALCFLLRGAGTPPPVRQASLYWTNPVANLSTDLCFFFWSNNVVSAPSTNWPFFTNVWATNYTDANLVPTNLDATGTNGVFRLSFMTAPDRLFVYGGGSNFWGMFFFTNVPMTPPSPANNGFGIATP